MGRDQVEFPAFYFIFKMALQAKWHIPGTKKKEPQLL